MLVDRTVASKCDINLGATSVVTYLETFSYISPVIRIFLPRPLTSGTFDCRLDLRVGIGVRFPFF